MRTDRRAPAVAATLLALLALPPVTTTLQESMPLQVLLQLPLLVLCGYLLRAAISANGKRTLAACNPAGINGLIVATFVLMFWMLPRAMDASVTQGGWTAARLVTLPLLAGLPLGLSWPRMNFVVRGVVCLELIATCLRLGLLYLASPVRLCNSYGLDQQQLTGHCLLAIGAALLAWIALQLFVGQVRVRPDHADQGLRAHQEH